MIPFQKIREAGDWTLFLDRDGTINKRLPNDYVKTTEEFEFLPRALEAIKIFSQLFQHVIIVTNQQGIGKELMTDDDLHVVHDNMTKDIIANGGYIDQIYYCPYLAIDNPTSRKPNPGMAFQAAEDFPEIHFKRSLMIGDTMSDMLFGHQLGMKTILLNSASLLGKNDAESIVGMEMASLYEVALYLRQS